MPRLLAQICFLAFQAFRKAQKHRGSPAQPVPGQSVQLQTLGPGGAMEATPGERGLDRPVASTPRRGPPPCEAGGPLHGRSEARRGGFSRRTVSELEVCRGPLPV